MNHKHAQSHKILTAGLVLLLTMMACSQSPNSQNEPLPAGGAQPPASVTLPEQPSPAAGEVAIETSDPCSLLTKEQVEAAFGKTAQLGKPGERLCYYQFDDLVSQFNVTIVEKENEGKEWTSQLSYQDKNTGCERDINQCGFFPSQNHPEIAANVMTFERINTFTKFWGTTLVALSDNKSVRLDYSIAIPADALQALKDATDKESYYKIATPFRDQVLSGYTEILIKLLKVSSQ